MFRLVTPGRSFVSVNGRGLLFRLLDVDADDEIVPLPKNMDTNFVNCQLNVDWVVRAELVWPKHLLHDIICMFLGLYDVTSTTSSPTSNYEVTHVKDRESILI